MSLVPSARLGPYEIVAAIGAGGMGDVYKARDTRLDRTVAIKVLSPVLAADPSFRERFDREARTISALTHPHICTLHDVGTHDGHDFLVMEYLEGETLAARLARGAMPVHEALKHAIQIADALDRAHRQGVVHRDLKPGNVMLTRSGVKLLDFGLAKHGGASLQAGQAEAWPHNVATVSTPLTARGSILGTFQYMAPEQLEGCEADARSDLFAFGCVLYEMLTGRKAFEGRSQASLIAAILGAEPPAVSSLQPLATPALERIVRKALAKEPDERWQTARDLLDELSWIASSEATASAASAGRAMPRRAARAAIVALGTLLVCAATGYAVWILTRPAAPTVARFSMDLAAAPPQLVGGEQAIAISPDGTRIVYVGRAADRTQSLYIRDIGDLEARPIAGTEGGSTPFFSPDGAWIGFFAGGTMKKVPFGGGAAVTICAAAASGVRRGAAWMPDGTIFFPATTASGLSRVPAAGGTPEPLTTLDSKGGERSHRWPWALPGGRAILFTVQPSSIASFDDARIVVQSLETGERKVVVEGGAMGRFLAPGHVVYSRAGALFALPFDPDRLEALGPAAPVLEGVATFPVSGAAQFAVSHTGLLAYIPGTRNIADQSLVWVDRAGKVTRAYEHARPFLNVALSPDGRRAAVQIAGGNTDIFVYELARGTLTRLTFDPGSDIAPVWRPDGRRIAFGAIRASPVTLFWKTADGSAPEEAVQTDRTPNNRFPHAWTPDGQTLVFVEQGQGNDIWLLPLTGDRRPKPVLVTPFNETSPTLSPDGRWMAYQSDEAGRFEIYVQPFPGPGGKWQISTDGGTLPRWSRDGREVFYRAGTRLMSVPVRATAGSFEAGIPRPLFEGSFTFSYSVTNDGRRFLMLQKLPQAQPTQANVVLNWAQELRHKAPPAGGGGSR